MEPIPQVNQKNSEIEKFLIIFIFAALFCIYWSFVYPFWTSIPMPAGCDNPHINEYINTPASIKLLLTFLPIFFLTFIIYGLYRIISGIIGVFRRKDDATLKTNYKKRLIFGFVIIIVTFLVYFILNIFISIFIIAPLTAPYQTLCLPPLNIK